MQNHYMTGISTVLSCGDDIQLADGTSVVLLRRPSVPVIMRGEAPEVLLHQ